MNKYTVGLIFVSFLLIVLISKSSTTIYKPYEYACKKQAPNPNFQTYNSSKNTYVDNCVNKLKLANPEKFKRYEPIFKTTVDNSYELSIARDECTKEWNFMPENFGKLPPSEKIETDVQCQGEKPYECITFFGKCIFVANQISR